MAKKPINVDQVQAIVKDYTTGLKGKVDVEQGKGLSTNDYDATAKGIVDSVTQNLGNKVDKVEGKGLSTKDYTEADQTKLSGIETGAQANKIEEVELNGTVFSVTGKKASGTIDVVSNSSLTETLGDYLKTDELSEYNYINQTALNNAIKDFVTSTTLSSSIADAIAALGTLFTFAAEPIITKSQMATLKSTAKKGTAYLVSDDNNHLVFFFGTDVSGTDENGFYDTGLHVDFSGYLNENSFATDEEVNQAIAAGKQAANQE